METWATKVDTASNFLKHVAEEVPPEYVERCGMALEMLVDVLRDWRKENVAHD